MKQEWTGSHFRHVQIIKPRTIRIIVNAEPAPFLNVSLSCRRKIPSKVENKGAVEDIGTAIERSWRDHVFPT